jgi:hypothetical protein
MLDAIMQWDTEFQGAVGIENLQAINQPPTTAA